jgi:hypothetical protein
MPTEGDLLNMQLIRLGVLTNPAMRQANVSGVSSGLGSNIEAIQDFAELPAPNLTGSTTKGRDYTTRLDVDQDVLASRKVELAASYDRSLLEKAGATDITEETVIDPRTKTPFKFYTASVITDKLTNPFSNPKIWAFEDRPKVQFDPFLGVERVMAADTLANQTAKAAKRDKDAAKALAQANLRVSQSTDARGWRALRNAEQAAKDAKDAKGKAEATGKLVFAYEDGMAGATDRQRYDDLNRMRFDSLLQLAKTLAGQQGLAGEVYNGSVNNFMNTHGYPRYSAATWDGTISATPVYNTQLKLGPKKKE